MSFPAALDTSRYGGTVSADRLPVTAFFFDLTSCFPAGAAFAERSFAWPEVGTAASDLMDDTAGDDRKTAWRKVNERIGDAGVTGGTAAMFPEGELSRTWGRLGFSAAAVFRPFDGSRYAALEFFEPPHFP